MTSTLPGGQSPTQRTLLLTRPMPEASEWAASLSDAGYAVELLPLMETTAPTLGEDQQSLAYWRENWPTASAVMVVSPAAARWFFASGSSAKSPSGREGAGRVDTRWWSPGPGTAKVLKPLLNAVGVPSVNIDCPGADAPQFDSEALWAVVSNQVTSESKILVVRGRSRLNENDADETAMRPGGDGRQWLLEQCRAMGAEVHACVAYERRPVEWSEAQWRAARQSTSPESAWLFSSSESIDLLRVRMPEQEWSEATALATHPKIASAATAMGFGTVISCRPGLSDVRAALESHWSSIQ